jgi:hypothetical protein
MSVGTETGSGVGFPAAAAQPFRLPNVQICSEPPPSFLVRGIGRSFLGVERPGREAELSPSSSAKVTNEWSCTSVPHTCLHSVD